MGILMLLIPLALVLSLAGASAFYWAWRHNQFEDLDTNATQVVLDDDSMEGSQDHDNRNL